MYVRIVIGTGASKLDDGVAGTLAQLLAAPVDAAHARLCGERDEGHVGSGHIVLADPVLLREHDDRAALGSLVGQ